MEHIVRRQIESQRAYRRRRKTIGFVMVLALVLSMALAMSVGGLRRDNFNFRWCHSPTPCGGCAERDGRAEHCASCG